MDPEEAIDRIAAGQGAPPGHRVLHAKGHFYSGTFNASPEATALCRAGHLQGESVPVLVRWSHGSGRPDANDDMPYVRGMSVSFVLPDGTSTDLLGQTIPRFPVRTPEDFVRLTEVARDRRELAKFLATAAPHGARPRRERPGPGARAAEELRRGDVLPRPRVPLAQPVRARDLGAVPARAAARTASPRQVRRTRAAAGGAAGPARRQGPVAFDLIVDVAAAKDDPHNPMSVWRGSREFVAGWFEITTPEDDHEAEGDLVVFDPTRVVDGIELSEDPILRYRPSAYSVSIERRTPHP